MAAIVAIPLDPQSTDLPDRFKAKVTLKDRGFDTPCWAWTGAIQSHGYGNFYHAGKWYLAHRFAYEWLAGEVPEGLELDHSRVCTSRWCVNPGHVEPVTHQVNVARGRSANGEKTHCKRGHALAGGNLIRQGKRKQYRACRACKRLTHVLNRARKRRDNPYELVIRRG